MTQGERNDVTKRSVDRLNRGRPDRRSGGNATTADGVGTNKEFQARLSSTMEPTYPSMVKLL